MTVPAHLRVSLHLQSKTAQGQSGWLLWPRPRDSPGSWRGVGEPGDQCSPLPWTNTAGVAGHPRSSCKAFIPEKLISGECVSFSIYTGVLGQRWVAELKRGLPRHQRFVVFSAAASLCSSLPRTAAWTPLWEDQDRVDAHAYRAFCYNPNMS